METIFSLSAGVAILSTLLVITQTNAVHALLYLIVSLLSVAVIFFVLGAPFVAALQVIVYAGAIMVLFVFVIMMLNLGSRSTEQERQWLGTEVWTGPAVLALILIAELVYVLAANASPGATGARAIDPKQVGVALFGPYLLGVELASMLLLAGLVGAYHRGRQTTARTPEPGEAAQAAYGDGRGLETNAGVGQTPPPEAARTAEHLRR